MRFTFSSIIVRSESFTAKTTVSLPPAHHHDTNATETTAASARGSETGFTCRNSHALEISEGLDGRRVGDDLSRT
jgi:hypothetical protein